jgi:hypothetical protein
MKLTAKASGLFCRVLLITGFFALAIPVATAQSIECAQFNAPNELSFQFTNTFTRSSVSGAQFIVRKLSDGSSVGYSKAEYSEEELPNSVVLTLSGTLVPGELYVLYVANLQFGSKSPQMIAPIDTTKRCGKPKEPDMPEGRDDANVYLEGMLTTSSGEGLHGTIDTKLRRSLYITDTTTNSNPDLINDLGLALDFKASGDPDADPDSFNFGVELETNFTEARNAGPIKYLFNYLYPKIESERDFDNTNLMLEDRLKFGLRRPFRKPWAPLLSPFAGVEVGKNLRSPLAAAEGSGIFRVKAGTLLNLYFEPKLKNLQTIELDAEYTRRWPLRRELSFEEDDDKKLQLVEFGKRPRDYVKANLNFMLTDSFGATVGYEYGELPPSFKLVDHKLKIGLVFKTK